MEKVTSNIRHLRKSAGFTQAQLAEKLDIKRSLVGAYEEGRAEPKLSTLVNVAKLFDVSLDELITADLSNPLYKPTANASGGGKLRVLAITVDQDERENIELVPHKASAGYLNGYADPEFIEELPRFKLPTLGTGGTYRAFEISGDSMLPIASGTVIVGRFVDDWSSVKDGTPCIVVSEKEGVVFKRVYNKLKEASSLRLHSDNPVYSPYEVHMEDVLEIWEAKSYISSTFPIADLSLDKLSSIVLDLQKEMQKLKKA
ncbi:helix-turn-helix domain-containing protein [Pontibacter sp. JH31]|uniref:Helix-turn-helix domain-containing protein n=1 Tax=Pontibacter aquaedesilientis TaxID=2766980 RepID=A0ABR7XDC7_9BACT|nr:LexA family transcriptional regulator [Pontibacter aquaedesilientis]MBD1396289.1 helix-turn-helix domain-containing protein [Pontibacter aquaedesilientis]